MGIVGPDFGIAGQAMAYRHDSWKQNDASL
jgi:hypothetical protein